MTCSETCTIVAIAALMVGACLGVAIMALAQIARQLTPPIDATKPRPIDDSDL